MSYESSKLKGAKKTVNKKKGGPYSVINAMVKDGAGEEELLYLINNIFNKDVQQDMTKYVKSLHLPSKSKALKLQPKSAPGNEPDFSSFFNKMKDVGLFSSQAYTDGGPAWGGITPDGKLVNTGFWHIGVNNKLGYGGKDNWMEFANVQGNWVQVKWDEKSHKYILW